MSATVTPEMMRVNVGGSRHYRDPLPDCPIAPACDDAFPSVTTIKKAWAHPFRKKLPSGDTVPLDAFWCAEYVVKNMDRLWGVENDDDLLRDIATAGGRTLNRAANRGTAIHGVLEAMAAGEVVDELTLTDDAYPYLEACKAFVADCQPKWIVSELVIVNRGLGFAGTLDAVIEIDGVRYLTDWKTRSGAHGAYAEDAAQVGGYSMAEYAIENGKRRLPPPVDMGLVVSLSADEGYRLYPVDLLQSAYAFTEMLECWHRRQDGTKAARASIGEPLDPAATSGLGLWLTGRIVTMRDSYPEALADLASRWPEGVPTLKQGGHSLAELRIIAGVVTDVEALHQMPF